MDNWNILKHIRSVETVLELTDILQEVRNFDDTALIEEVEYIMLKDVECVTEEVPKICNLYHETGFLAGNNRKKLEAVYCLHYSDSRLEE